MRDWTKDRPVQAMAFTDGALASDGLVSVRISPPGIVESRNGTYLLDETSAHEIIAAFETHGTDLVIDYDHQTLGGEFAAPDGRALAAGWIRSLYYSNKGLFGQIKWNPKARDAIREHEYKYLSPVLQVRKSDNRAIGLHSAALTNTPAIPRMDRLAASTRGLDDKIVAHANEQPTNMVGVPIDLMRKLREVLGLDQTSSPSQVIEAAIKTLSDKKEGEDDEGEDKPDNDKKVAAMVRTRLGLAADAGTDEVTLALSLHGDAGAHAEVMALKQAAREKEVDERLWELAKENRINPNDREMWEASRRLALSDRSMFESIVGRANAYLPVGKTTPPPRPSGGGSRHAVSGDRRRIIASAAREFQGDARHAKITSCVAFVNQALREAGETLLTETEVAEWAGDTVVA